MYKKRFEALDTLIQQQYTNITGLIITQDNEPIYENYFNDYTPQDTIHIASVTKSIISILIGIAIDKGFIGSIDDKVIDYFPNYIPKRGEKTLPHITLKHLLTMTDPYKYKSEPYTKIYSSNDWTTAALDLLGGKKAIGSFNYSTVGTHILSGILIHATGQSVSDFAATYLFNPLGINLPPSIDIPTKDAYLSFLKDKHVRGWVADSKGTHTAGWGLTLTTRDLAKIGQLYLNNGMYQGKQLITSSWIKDSTSVHSKWGEASYGYLWWVLDDGYAALGDSGNVIFVSPRHHLVVAITSRFMPRAKDRLAFITNFILP